MFKYGIAQVENGWKRFPCKEFIFLDDKYCGHTYQSCVNTFGPIDTSVLITLIIFGILTLGIAIVSIYYLCIRRKQLPTVHTTARVQSTTMGRRTHQEIISYVDSNTSNSIQIPIMESAPPPYEQNHRENFATESENV